MGLFKKTAWAAVLVGGALAAAVPASAASIGTGLAGPAANPLVEEAQYYGYGPGYGYRRGWRGPRYGYRPPVVCRIRYTPWGPRRVCFRRW